jgi:hypothetical protein
MKKNKYLNFDINNNNNDNYNDNQNTDRKKISDFLD